MIYYLTHLSFIQGYFYQSRKIICIIQQLEESKRNVFTLCGTRMHSSRMRTALSSGRPQGGLH